MPETESTVPKTCSCISGNIPPTAGPSGPKKPTSLLSIAFLKRRKKFAVLFSLPYSSRGLKLALSERLSAFFSSSKILTARSFAVCVDSYRDVRESKCTTPTIAEPSYKPKEETILGSFSSALAASSVNSSSVKSRREFCISAT